MSESECLDVHRLQLLVVVGEVTQLGRADEGEVTGVEEEDGPLAIDVGVGDLNEVPIAKSVGLEGDDLGVDETHEESSLVDEVIVQRYH